MILSFRSLLLLLFLLPSSSRAFRTRQQALEELGLKRQPQADEATIKAAYRQRSLETHPDKGGSPDDFIQVASAYEYLVGGGSSSSTASNAGGGYGTSKMTEEEQVEWARDKFFEHFTTVMEDSDKTAESVVNWIFPNGKGSEKEKWFRRPDKAAVRWIAKKCTKTLMSMFESENVVITFSSDGRKMTGTEFTQRRLEAVQRKNARVAQWNAYRQGASADEATAEAAEEELAFDEL